MVGTPTPGCGLSPSRPKGRVLFLAPVGTGDNGRLAFHRPAGGSLLLSSVWLFWTHTTPPLSLVSTGHTAGGVTCQPTCGVTCWGLHTVITKCDQTPRLSLLTPSPSSRSPPDTYLWVPGSQKTDSSGKKMVSSNDFFFLMTTLSIITENSHLGLALSLGNRKPLCLPRPGSLPAYSSTHGAKVFT